MTPWETLIHFSNRTENNKSRQVFLPNTYDNLMSLNMCQTITKGRNEGIRTDMGLGEGQDPVKEIHHCGPMPRWGPKGLKKKRTINTQDRFVTTATITTTFYLHFLL